MKKKRPRPVLEDDDPPPLKKQAKVEAKKVYDALPDRVEVPIQRSCFLHGGYDGKDCPRCAHDHKAADEEAAKRRAKTEGLFPCPKCAWPNVKGRFYMKAWHARCPGCGHAFSPTP